MICVVCDVVFVCSTALTRDTTKDWGASWTMRSPGTLTQLLNVWISAAGHGLCCLQHAILFPGRKSDLITGCLTCRGERYVSCSLTGWDMSHQDRYPVRRSWYHLLPSAALSLPAEIIGYALTHSVGGRARRARESCWRHCRFNQVSHGSGQHS